MSTVSGENHRWELAPCYRELAEKERAELTPEQTRILSQAEDCLEEAVLPAYLHKIDRKMQEIGMERVELSGRFENITPSAISKWFTMGQVSAAHFAKLICEPEFRGLEPSEEECIVHGYRHVVTWIRRKVLGIATRCIGYEEFLLLAELHTIDDMDVEVVTSQLPALLVNHVSKCDAPRLYRVRYDWGKAYRLFVTEKKR